MRAVIVDDWKPFDQLELRDVPPPELGPRHVRIRGRACGVSFAMSLVVQGKYQRKPPRPFSPGSEYAGIVTEVGTEVTRFRPGDRVVAVLDWGGLAEEAAALEVNTFRLPDSLQFHRAVAFTNSYFTSYAALCWPNMLRLAAGETLLVHGSAGGVGIAAVEIGRIIGATVIATAGSPEKLEVARSHGADHVISYRTGGFREEVLRITDGRGADVVYDPVGGEVFTESLRCIAFEGRIMPVGFAGGTIPQIPANILLVKTVSVVGLNLGTYFGWSPNDIRYEAEAKMRAGMDRMFSWFEEGRISPRVDRTFPLENFRQAMAELLARKVSGRVAVTMNE